MDCWDITKLLQQKNNINNSMQIFGNLHFSSSDVNMKQITAEIKNFNKDLEKMEKMKEYMQEIRSNCGKESGWENWLDGQDAVKEINNKLDTAIKNLKEFLHSELEKKKPNEN